MNLRKFKWLGKGRWALWIMLLAHCQSSGQYMESYSGAVVVPSGQSTLTLRPPSLQQIQPLQQPTTQSQSLRSADLRSAKTTGVLLRLTEGEPSSDLSFIRQVRIIAESPTADRMVLAEGANIAVNETTIGLQIVNEDVRDWLQQPSLSLLVELEMDPIEQDRTIDCLWEVEVQYQLFNRLCAF